MPTVLSLLIFIALLLPGIAYLAGSERAGTRPSTSPFRDTVTILAASVSSEILVLVLFGILRSLLPEDWTPDATALLTAPRQYLAGLGGFLPGNLGLVAGWAVAMLGLAVAISYAVTLPRLRELLTRPGQARQNQRDSVPESR